MNEGGTFFGKFFKKFQRSQTETAPDNEKNAQLVAQMTEQNKSILDRLINDQGRWKQVFDTFGTYNPIGDGSQTNPFHIDSRPTASYKNPDEWTHRLTLRWVVLKALFTDKPVYLSVPNSGSAPTVFELDLKSMTVQLISGTAVRPLFDTLHATDAAITMVDTLRSIGLHDIHEKYEDGEFSIDDLTDQELPLEMQGDGDEAALRRGMARFQNAMQAKTRRQEALTEQELRYLVMMHAPDKATKDFVDFILLQGREE